MSKINKITSEILSQSLTDSTIFSSFDKKIKNKFKQIGISSLLAITASMSAGTAYAFDVGSIVNLLVNPNYNPQSYYYNLSDVPTQCNDFSKYVLSKNSTTLSNNITESYVIAAKQSENSRLDCAKNIYNSYGINAPKYRQNTYIDSSIILYEIRDSYGGNEIQINYGNSPSVKAFTSGTYGNINLSTEPKLKNSLDERSKQLIIAHELLNKVSRDFLNSAYGTDDPNNQNSRNSQRINLSYRYKDQLEKAYDNYAQARTDFISLADSAAFSNINISNYASIVDYISPPESTNLSFKGRLPNRYTYITPSGLKL